VCWPNKYAATVLHHYGTSALASETSCPAHKMADGHRALPVVRVCLPGDKIQKMGDVSYRTCFGLIRWRVETKLGFGPVRLHLVVDGEDKPEEPGDEERICYYFDGKAAPLIVATKR